MGSALALSMIAALGLVVGKAEPAMASNIAVSPVNIYLARAGASALLTLTNQGSDSISFSVHTYSWTQGESGEIDLAPTSDIIFFPTLLTIAPGESRNIRLGTELQPGSIEKTYRIVLDELPAARTAQTHPAMQVRVLTRLSIPIFLTPVQTHVQADVSDVAVSKGVLSVRVDNPGTEHIVPSMSVIGLGASGETTYSLGPHQLWYILAGGVRNVNVPLPSKPCAKVRTVQIVVHVDSLVVKKSVSTPSGACAS